MGYGNVQLMTFREFLVEIDAGQDVVLEALKIYVSRVSDFTPTGSLLTRFRSDEESSEVVYCQLRQLESNPGLLEPAALEVLSWAWEEPDQTEEVRLAFQAAKRKTPVFDASVIQLVAVFGLLYMGWLVITRGRKQTVRKVKRHPDGSLEEEETTVFQDSPLVNLEKLHPLAPFQRRDDDKNKSEA